MTHFEASRWRPAAPPYRRKNDSSRQFEKHNRFAQRSSCRLDSGILWRLRRGEDRADF
jgi:hypothetical protein